MVQPLHAYFLAGAFAQGFLHVVAGHIGEQAVYPAAQLIAGLGSELGLPVERPNLKPVRIFTVTMPPVTTPPENGSRRQMLSI